MPTGATDVTAALKAFLESHDGQRVALAVNGRYKVTQMSFTASDLTVDFRGAQIQGTLPGALGIFKIQSSSNIVINDANIEGTGYAWSGGGDNPNQNEHGIQVDGGADITINNPTTRNTLGDGIYIGYEASGTKPPTGVVINNPNIERASRNGISPVAGEVTIRGGHIAYTGLFGVDFEPNNDVGAMSIRGVVDGVDIRHYADLPAAKGSCTCYAVAAGGYSTATKPSMTVENPDRRQPPGHHPRHNDGDLPKQRFRYRHDRRLPALLVRDLHRQCTHLEGVSAVSRRTTSDHWRFR